MWTTSVPWWELVIRGSVVFLVLFAMLRLIGRRQVGQLTPFDLVLLLIISNAVQNAMVGSDNSLAGGLIVAAVLVAWNFVFGALALRSRRIERVLEGSPELLVLHGRVLHEALERNQISDAELRAALRRAGCFEVGEVELAVLETNGGISVKKRDGAPRER
ncbi:MAG TPA: YetF domain-containing protein [Tahibacter sp.]|nr:YetF domain-containing protein [Tahibacter sp.]